MVNFTYSDAVALIKAALESKAITLNGPASNDTLSPTLAKRDSTYLRTLLTQLTAESQQ